MIAASAVLVAAIRPAFPAAFAVTVLHLAHAFERMLRKQFSFLLISFCRRALTGRSRFFFVRHNLFWKKPQKTCRSKHTLLLDFMERGDRNLLLFSS